LMIDEGEWLSASGVPEALVHRLANHAQERKSEREKKKKEEEEKKKKKKKKKER
jgi:hypothetical protein